MSRQQKHRSNLGNIIQTLNNNSSKGILVNLYYKMGKTIPNQVWLLKIQQPFNSFLGQHEKREITITNDYKMKITWWISVSIILIFPFEVMLIFNQFSALKLIFPKYFRRLMTTGNKFQFACLLYHPLFCGKVYKNSVDKIKSCPPPSC